MGRYLVEQVTYQLEVDVGHDLCLHNVFIVDVVLLGQLDKRLLFELPENLLARSEELLPLLLRCLLQARHVGGRPSTRLNHSPAAGRSL